MTGSFKAFRQNLFLLVGSIVLTAVFAEVMLRMVLPAPIIWKYPQEQYQYDADIGHWLKPDQRAYTHDKEVSTNSVGIRDSEYASDKSPEVYRILALGDSQTFGNGLELTDTWPKQLETNLNQASNGRRVEVINAGLPGSDTWQHEIILKRMFATYQPDAVVLAFYVNDVVKRFKPRPVQEKNSGDLSKRVGYILKRSTLLLTLRIARNAIMQWWSPSKGSLQQQALLKGGDSPALRERWNQVDNSLSAMKKVSDEHKAPFGIVLLPRRDQVGGRLPWETYSNHLQQIAKQYQIPVVSLLAPLQQAYQIHGKDLFIPWDGHNSKIANNIIAREIADKMVVVRQGK